MRRFFDATELEASSLLASSLIAVYRYFSPTRRRLYALEQGQETIKTTLKENHDSLDAKITGIYTLLAQVPTRRRP